MRRDHAVALSPARGLQVKVPSPSGNPELSLDFWMENGIATLAFGDQHTHENCWESPEAFIGFVDDIAADRRLFLVVETGATRWWTPDEPIEDEIADMLTGPNAPDAVRVVSWSGKFD